MHYTVNEFRASTRKVLDLADTGEEVIIKRYDKAYIIAPIIVSEKSTQQLLEELRECPRHHIPKTDCAHLHV